jgi:hypothetical protein
MLKIDFLCPINHLIDVVDTVGWAVKIFCEVGRMMK